MSARPSVGVIGAGISGLTASKALQDYGVEHTVFEAGDRIGGNWAFKNPNGRSSAYRSLHIDTSRSAISFRDFPMSERYPDYPHHTEIFEYLGEYADAFGLRPSIRFKTEVSSAVRLPGGGWELTAGGEAQRFDVLVVGNGHHWDPRLPDFPGTFDGPTIHSHHYVDPVEPLDLRDKRVLVVGIGNSAVDITSELARKGIARDVFISTRSGAYVIPKYIFGRPTNEVVQTNPRIPLGLQRRVARIFPRLVSGRMEDFGLPTPNHNFLEAHPTVSSELLLRLGSGDATAKPDVQELLGDRVRFVDGSVEEVDAIVYATGYNISFPFFDEALISAPDNRLPLFKRMLKPGIEDLVFVGFAQAIPTIFPFVELQARLLARYAVGLYRPPAEAEMTATIEADHAAAAGHFTDKPRHTMQTDFYVYQHDLVTRELPRGLERARRDGPVALAGRAGAAVPV
jgi:cation diffusion facilitator CzcD-associated flavoprotein CzcO